MTGAVVRIPLGMWMAWKWRALAHQPRAVDRPVATVAGDPVIHCLVLGDGPISGWGVASHQLGLVGALARSLARRFEHGTQVKATIEPGGDVRAMRRLADDVPWETAQVGVLSFGPGEVLAAGGIARWQHDLGDLISAVRARMPQGSVLVVLGIPPVGAVAFLRGIGHGMLRRLVDRYNAATRALCRDLDGVRFAQLPAPAAGRPVDDGSDYVYGLWAEVIADAVGLDPADVRPRTSDEGERAAAVERLGILDSPREARFDRVVRLARTVFRTRSAGFTVLQGDRQWYKARVGIGVSEIPRRYSMCEIAVREGAPLVVGDAAADPRFADNPYVRDGDVRFYAGYPLRAPEGHFVGALCVFDPEPRDPADVDVAVLRELALLVEAELEHTAAS